MHTLPEMSIVGSKYMYTLTEELFLGKLILDEDNDN